MADPHTVADPADRAVTALTRLDDPSLAAMTLSWLANQSATTIIPKNRTAPGVLPAQAEVSRLRRPGPSAGRCPPRAGGGEPAQTPVPGGGP
ncbi:hypothetical protein [Streptomyces mirabilis]|uniref:hypothetical protein n=1 Tax=Streptomyces mirabilis TaxID=68239 RepID=UPI002250BD3E|nr:hypothetical protein [Streptomyces mirabilis]MCX4419343.1 hypothetical protein [Streptomyces mirabilis]